MARRLRSSALGHVASTYGGGLGPDRLRARCVGRLDHQEQAETARKFMVETAAEMDEELLEHYLEHEDMGMMRNYEVLA